MRTLPVLLFGSVLMVLTAAADAESGNTTAEEETHLDKRWISCAFWTRIYGRGFRYIRTPMTWAAAERNCLALGGNLASVHSSREYYKIQKMIFLATHTYGKTWLGGSDAQQNGFWLWSNGKRFNYANWCPHEPNNYGGRRQDCLQMNFGDRKCWDDLQCHFRRPSVCAKKCRFLG